MNGLSNWVSVLFKLIKVRLSIFVTLSTATGFILTYQGISLKMVPALVGVFLLVSGCSALNQYQERREDLLMERTRSRPIPSGRISPSFVLKVSFVLLSFGVGLLGLLTDLTSCGLGILAALLYNGVYTPLKKKTLFALFPGALVGAIPPAMGWIAGGGDLDARMLALSSFFFVWQIPHTWLLLLDFRADYQKAGFPSPVQLWGLPQAENISCLWVLATVVSTLLIPLFGIATSCFILGGLLLLAIIPVWNVFQILLIQSRSTPFHLAYKAMNRYMFLVMVLLSLDHLFL